MFLVVFDGTFSHICIFKSNCDKTDMNVLASRAVARWRNNIKQMPCGFDFF